MSDPFSTLPDRIVQAHLDSLNTCCLCGRRMEEKEENLGLDDELYCDDCIDEADELYQEEHEVDDEEDCDE